MRPDIYWIETVRGGRLAVMLRPRAGDWLADEIAGLRMAGVDLVVSLLQRDEVLELGLKDEEQLCLQNEMEFISFPIRDRGVPDSVQEAMPMVRSIADAINSGRAVAIHCRAGIRRSATVAACSLICLGLDPKEALDKISEARGLRVPDTEEQQD